MVLLCTKTVQHVLSISSDPKKADVLMPDRWKDCHFLGNTLLSSYAKIRLFTNHDIHKYRNMYQRRKLVCQFQLRHLVKAAFVYI